MGVQIKVWRLALLGRRQACDIRDARTIAETKKG